ncbi:translation initiation factor IF-3 [Candidatus Dependentiae bacterium]
MSKNRFNNHNSDNRMASSNYTVNNQIKASSVQVINQKGENIGVISKIEALNLANEAGLDLVQVGEKDSVVITKIMDFGKFLYTKKKQLSEAKKKQKIIQVKEIKLRPNIGDQDYKTKLNRAIGFLTSGKKVKFTIQFRGREFIMINDLGRGIFQRIDDDLASSDIGNLVQEKEKRGGPFWSKIYYLK